MEKARERDSERKGEMRERQKGRGEREREWEGDRYREVGIRKSRLPHALEQEMQSTGI